MSWARPGVSTYLPLPQVSAALERWDPTHPAASFVFTSSMSVCAVDDGGSVSDEHCPLNPLGKSPSVDRLLLAEQAVLQVWWCGCVRAQGWIGACSEEVCSHPMAHDSGRKQALCICVLQPAAFAGHGYFTAPGPESTPFACQVRPQPPSLCWSRSVSVMRIKHHTQWRTTPLPCMVPHTAGGR